MFVPQTHDPKDRQKAVSSWIPPKHQDVQTITYLTCTISEASPKITKNDTNNQDIAWWGIDKQSNRKGIPKTPLKKAVLVGKIEKQCNHLSNGCAKK